MELILPLLKVKSGVWGATHRKEQSLEHGTMGHSVICSGRSAFFGTGFWRNKTRCKITTYVNRSAANLFVSNVQKARWAALYIKK